MIKEALISARITVGVVVAAGGGAMMYSAFDDTLHPESLESMEQRAKELVHGYNPQEFRAREQVIADFTKTAGKAIRAGKNTIEVPEDVTQAVSYIKKQQETNNLGDNLVGTYHTESGVPRILKIIGKLAGGYLAVPFGFEIARGRLSQKKEDENAVSTKA